MFSFEPSKTAIRLVQHSWLSGVIGVVFVMNICDALLTIAWVETGAATESNPFMDAFLSMGTVPFYLAKLLLVSGGMYLLWVNRRRPLAVFAIFFVFLVYYWIFLYHLNTFGWLVSEVLFPS